MQVEEITPGFGARITGLDLSGPLAPEMEADIVETVARYGVGVFPAAGLDDAGHVWFSRMFGNLWTIPGHATAPARFAYPHLFDAGNLTREGTISPDETARARRAGDRLWHTDSSFTKDRTSYSLLMAHEVPSQGGETFFADMRGAYEALPKHMQDRVEGLSAVHSWWHSRQQAGFPVSDEEVEARQPQAVHPLVHVHPISGRKSLYIAAHAMGIVGMEKADGQALLAQLMAHGTQDRFTFAHHWQPGDIVIWDNFSTMHRGGAYDDVNERRDMRRTTVMAWPPPPVVLDPRFVGRFDPDQFRALMHG